MKISRFPTLAVGSALALCQVPTLAQSATTVDASQVCVTNGEISRQNSDKLAIESPSSRAVVKSSDDSFGAIEFEYLGPTAKDAPFASGRIVRQLGVKLRARSCNSIYIMWNADEDSGLKISKQINPNKSTHAQCGVKGYKMLYESKSGDFAPIHVGEPRRLEAALKSRTLTVKIDGKNVWQGDVGVDAANLTGHSGIRTDNVRVRLRWLTAAQSVADNAAISNAPKLNCRSVAARALPGS
jgi:hypothetical protein